MITKVALLFLFGTSMASNIFMSKLKSTPYEIALVPRSQFTGCPSEAELAPLICKFMQANLNLYYKPNLIAPLTYIPPLVVEKCETPELEMDIELPGPIVEKKPVIIPQPPELPPLVIPKFPVPVIVEEQPATVSEPCESSDIPEMPVVNIPAAPQLAAIEMPVMPEIVVQPEPYLFKEAIPEIDYNVIDEKFMEIPQAPELPAFTMPEIPVHVEIPSGPVLPAMDIPSPPVIFEKPVDEPYLSEVLAAPAIDYNLLKYQTMSVSQPPELPAFIMPELTVVSPYFEDKSISQTPIHAHLASLASIPAAPELPPAVLPEFPVHVEIPSGPVLPAIDIPSPPMILEQPAEKPYHPEVMAAPEIDYNLIESAPMLVPPPPELPAFVMSDLPVKVVEEPPMVAAAPGLPSTSTLSEFIRPLPTFVGKPCESSGKLEVEFAAMPNPFEIYFSEKVKDPHNIMIPAQPMNSNFFPSPCVYNLVMQHIVPNIASDHFISLEKNKVLPPSFLPCS